MKIGDKIRPAIHDAIRLHDKLLLILSKDSVHSQWVKDEIEAAYEEEARRGKAVLFPLRLDDAVFESSEAWAAKLRRQRHIGDFTYTVDPGTAPPEDIADVLSDLSILYRKMGGSGINFSLKGIHIVEEELA